MLATTSSDGRGQHRAGTSSVRYNVFGVLRMMRAVLPAMRRERSGLIINVSSVLGFLPAPFMGLYASSKRGLEDAESLDHEVRGWASRVTLVEPSFTNTPFETNHSAPPIRSRLIRSSQANCGSNRRQAQDGSASEESVAQNPSGDQEQFPVATPSRDRGGLLSVVRRFMPACMVDKR